MRRTIWVATALVLFGCIAAQAQITVFDPARVGPDQMASRHAGRCRSRGRSAPRCGRGTIPLRAPSIGAPKGHPAAHTAVSDRAGSAA